MLSCKSHVFALFCFFCITFQSSAGAVDSVTLKAAQILSEYIQKASVKGQEKEAGEFLAHYCRQQGLHIRVFHEDEDSYNFAASLYPLDLKKPNIILQHHLDVVPEGDSSLWKYPPFSGHIDDTAVWGRGALDAKGIGVIQLVALLKLKETLLHESKYNVTLLALSDEESGGKRGIQRLIREDILQELNAVTVWGEGGGGMTEVLPSKPQKVVFGISVAEKTSMWLRLELNYKSGGHGATPPRNYVNRSMIMAFNRLKQVERDYRFTPTTKKMFKEIGKLEGGAIGFVMRHIHWGIFRPFVKQFLRKSPLIESLFTDTAILTNISNPPGPPNQIPTRVYATLDCRLLPGTNKKKFLKKVRAGLFEPRFNISIIDQCVDENPAQPDIFYANMEKSIKYFFPEAGIVPILFPSTTDNIFFRNAGIPAFGLLPFITNKEEMGSVHGANEKIRLESMKIGIDILTHFLVLSVQPPVMAQKK
jgi:acetylornithine deacetylase/succinyl-diaminopimelate desuccinylase-like protein